MRNVLTNMNEVEANQFDGEAEEIVVSCLSGQRHPTVYKEGKHFCYSGSVCMREDI